MAGTVAGHNLTALEKHCKSVGRVGVHHRKAAESVAVRAAGGTVLQVHHA